MHKRGFLLIECCIYIALCATLTATLMHWISQTMLEAGQQTIMIQKSLTHTLIYDSLMRDIQGAPCDKRAWHIAPDHIIWKAHDTVCVGWYKEKARLARKEGRYDFINDRWGKHHTSIVAHHVDVFNIEARHKEGDIRGFSIRLGIDGNEPNMRYIRLRNGRVYERA